MCPMGICRRQTAVGSRQFGQPMGGGLPTTDCRLPTRSRRHRRSESGFTLAGLIVVMTIIIIFIAYTVPDQWSKIMQREREKQTIFVMKQYARAIAAYSKSHGAPTSL